MFPVPKPGDEIKDIADKWSDKLDKTEESNDDNYESPQNL
jgi:hypothetical protein